MLNVLRQHGRAAWVVPTYMNGRALWRFAVSVCYPLVQAGLMAINKTERTITTFRDGLLALYSADNIDAMRGESFHLVVGDEASRIPDGAYADVIMPTLADYDGDCMLISTPKGKNWFYLEYERGKRDGNEQASFTAPSSDNPLPNIQKAVGLAKERVSARTYQQEWLAQFIDDGNVFRYIRELSKAKPTEPTPTTQYVVGVDWGRSKDATVFSVWDVAAKKEVALDRMTDTNYTLQIHRLKALADRYNRARVVAESNSIGDPLIEQAQRAGLSVTPFYTSNASKAHIVDQLALECEQRAIEFQDNQIGVGEMESFESKRTSSGLIKYSAPDGMHDDVVMARAIARNAARMPSGGALVSW